LRYAPEIVDGEEVHDVVRRPADDEHDRHDEDHLGDAADVPASAAGAAAACAPSAVVTAESAAVVVRKPAAWPPGRGPTAATSHI